MIYHFIVNPRARSGLGEMLWKQLEPELCRKRIDYQIHLTTKKKDAGKIKEKGISIQMRIQKNKGKKVFLHNPCEKEEPFGG